MRRASWFKPLAVVVGLWFSLFIGEPSLVSPCAMHGAFAAQAQGHGHAATAAASHAGASHHAAPADAPAPEQPHHCSCIDGCTAGVAAYVAHQPSVVDFGIQTYAAVDDYPSAGLRPTQPPDYSRPYTTGPPRA